jgi:hypothetical protein
LEISDNPDTYEVVDGQQRLVTIFEFLDNELSLAEESAKDLGGQTYDDLADKVKDQFDDYEIEYDLIEEASDEDVKRFFQRLQEGLPLTSSEKLNSVHSKLRDFIKKQTKHEFFKKTNVSDKRYGHFDVLAKTAAVEIDGMDAGLRFDDLRALFESQSSFSPTSKVAKRIIQALDVLNRGFTEGEAEVLRNRTILQSILTLVCRLIEGGDMTGQEKRIRKFVERFLEELIHQVELGRRASDTDYIDFQRTVTANIKSGAKIRQSILLRKLLAFDPSFAELFDAVSAAEGGLRTAVREDANAIAKLVNDLNTQYAAKHGEDLFKATNKTVQAQIALGTPITTFDDYKTFIENLYFIFHESSGSRLAGNVPQSFGDINTLRTDLQHDLDHGPAGKVRTKRKKSGTVFAKYSGIPSPVSLAPERFLVVQANLIGAVKSDLKKLVI